jgi:voltage-gated potassium channel Kch
MATALEQQQIYAPTTTTEYNIRVGGYFLIMPASVTSGAVLAFKATAEQGFVNIETISTPKIVFIPSTVTFKLTFADGSVTLTKLTEFVNT